MPIDLTKLVQTAPVNKYTPEFFNKQLIGNGGSIGLINHNVNPSEAYPNNNLTYAQLEDEKQLLELPELSNFADMTNSKAYIDDNQVSHKDTYLSLLPFSGMEHDDVMLTYTEVTTDLLGKWFDLGDKRVKARLLPIRALIHHTKNAFEKNWQKQLVIGYNLQLVLTTKITNFTTCKDQPLIINSATLKHDDQNTIKGCQHTLNSLNLTSSINDPHIFLYNLFTVDPIHSASLIFKNSLTAYYSDLLNYLKGYTIYDGLCALSESFQTNLVHFAKIAINNFKKNSTISLDGLLSNIEQMPTPLKQYQQLYQYLTQALVSKPAYRKQVLQSNLNFRFNHLLTNLSKVKPKLAAIPQQVPTSQKLSLEQQKAVSSPGPLTLVEAGAGTGKSMVLLNRIQYLLDGGIDPTDVLVLSFTNAAAQHINHLYPKVKSMTINAMVNLIYQANYQKQTIVSAKTFINSLKIEYGHHPQDPKIKQLLDAINDLNSIVDNTSFNQIDRGFQNLTSLIEDDPQKVLSVCTALGQTTFDIQIAVCFCGIDQITIPANIQAKHILVDEVQDNSTFDFMFLLRYVIFQKASFFIVGDANQTLYAFRNANPYALNILRASALFDIFQLQINYRSKPEILTYANVLLTELASNRFSNIQLKANNLAPIVPHTFKQRVQVEPIHNGREAFVNDIIQSYDLNKYISDCLKRDEKVAFLAYSHANLERIKYAITQLFNYANGLISTDISANHVPESTLFSDFWANLATDQKNKYATYPKPMLLNRIKNDFTHVLLTKRYRVRASKLWNDLITANKQTLLNLNRAYVNNQIGFNSYLQNLTGIMVRFEITNNYHIQQQNQQNNTLAAKKDKIKNSNFIFSTIHSAKGLEFDNVVLAVNKSQYHSVFDEADKRTIYVGLTRAINSEYVLVGDCETMDESLLMLNYSLALGELNKPSFTH